MPSKEYAFVPIVAAPCLSEGLLCQSLKPPCPPEGGLIFGYKLIWVTGRIYTPFRGWPRLAWPGADNPEEDLCYGVAGALRAGGLCSWALVPYYIKKPLPDPEEASCLKVKFLN